MVQKKIMLIVSISEVIKNNIAELFQKILPEDKNLYEKFSSAKDKLKQKGKDHYTLLKIMKHYIKLKKKSNEKLDDWLYQNFLKKDVLQKSYKYYQKMKGNSLQILKENNIELLDNYDKWKLKERILISMMGGYFLNVVSLSNNKYKISRDSWLKESDKKRIMYTELLTSGNRTNMQLCSYISDVVKKGKILC